MIELSVIFGIRQSKTLFPQTNSGIGPGGFIELKLTMIDRLWSNRDTLVHSSQSRNPEENNYVIY